MRFPKTFSRIVRAAGGTTLGTDTTPSADSPVTADNVLFSKFSNVNGWPVHRIAVAYKYTGSGTAKDCPARVLMWEDQLKGWFQVGADVNLKNGFVVFFDCVALLERANTQADLAQSSAGSLKLFLQVDAPVAPDDGTYAFAMGPDLTTQA